MAAGARKGERQEAADEAVASPGMDVIEILTEDHRNVEDPFDEYESAKDEAEDDAKAELVAQICLELVMHATIEEEIFYPAARDALEQQDTDLVDEAAVEHTTVKYLIAELSDMRPSDALYDAHVKVLREYVKHHVEEEEGEIFPALRETGLDLHALGEEVAMRKQELRDELAATESE